MNDNNLIYLTLRGPEDASEKYQKITGANIHVVFQSTSGNMATHYVTTYLRILRENNWLSDLRYMTKKTLYHEDM